MTAAVDRLAGYREAMRDAGREVDPVMIEAGDFTQDSGARAMGALLERCPDLDGLFAANDLMAAGALAVLHERGRRVPEDVALVGFDDSPVALTTRPPLTSVRQSLDAMGRELVSLLLDEHRRPRHGRPPGRTHDRAGRPWLEWRDADDPGLIALTTPTLTARRGRRGHRARARDPRRGPRDPRRHRRRSTAVRKLATLSAVVLLVAACGGSTPSQAPSATTAPQPSATSASAAPAASPSESAAASLAPGTLRVLVHQNPPFTDYMAKFNTAFEARHPGVKVDMAIEAPNSLATTTQTRLAANDVDVIDMFAFDTAVQPYMKKVDRADLADPGR